jgi:SAM-dependent MidA family methyltransferase
MVKFSEYMSKWLYAPQGYYATHNTIGKEGDFYTAVSSSMFFGGCIASRAIQSVDAFLSEECAIVEVGAHKGYLLADVIQFIYTLRPELLKTLSFYIVEPFTENRQAQLSYFEECFGDAINLLHVSSLKELTCKSAFVLANEIFDAFSCEVIKDNQMLFMKNHEPVFGKIDNRTLEIAQRYNITKGEVALGYEEFALEMANAFEKFEFVTFDYGDKASREDISLRVYAKHQVYPFFGLTNLVDENLRCDKKLEALFAKSDITYDVNFEHLIGAFEQSGITCKMYSSQMKALVSFGLIELLEMLQKNVSDANYKKELNRVKTLIDPASMGERFKMACFRKGDKK